MPLPPPEALSGKATKQTDRIIWAPSIPLIDQSELHQTISVHGILAQASQLRNGTQCTFTFSTDVKPFSGGQCIVFVIEYTDGIRYAFRLPYHSRRWKTVESFWLNELEHWSAFGKANVPFVSRIIGSSSSSHNSIGFPFLAYEWVEGKSLLWDDHNPQDLAQREEIIKSLVHFTIETACRLQKPGKISDQHSRSID
jgi:aminoglycoside phosphotransferase (APT) family kinase protein